MEYIRCLEILQIIKQAIEQEKFERLRSDFVLLKMRASGDSRMREDKELIKFIEEFEDKFSHYQKDISSDIRARYVKDFYGRVFRRCIELIQLSDLSKLNI